MQIKKRRKYVDTLELLDENETVCHVIHFSIDLTALKPIEQARIKLSVAQAQLQEKKEGATDSLYTAFGSALTELLIAIFGEENTACILEHYEKDYTELLIDIIPYISQVVFPRLQELSHERMQQIKNLRKRSLKKGLR